jgi:hypothetical protein
MHSKSYSGKGKGRDYSTDLGVKWRIILKWIFRNYRHGLNSLRIAYNGGSF